MTTPLHPRNLSSPTSDPKPHCCVVHKADLLMWQPIGNALHARTCTLRHKQLVGINTPLQIKPCPSRPFRPAAQPPAVKVKSTVPRLAFFVESETSMARLAQHLASQQRPGDVYCLYGEVGAGKSVFSRAFIRCAAGDETLPVPSPTFLLQNVYEGLGEEGETEAPAIHHFDLYRLAGVPAGALERLDLRSSFTHAVNLVEWPERLPEQMLPTTRLAVEIAIQPSIPSDQPAVVADLHEENFEFTDMRPRLVTLTAHGTHWHDRLLQLQQRCKNSQGSAGLRILPAPG